ncbi:MAG: hypothetical protein HY235_08150 [Acidobacteria bacterium]|nr:hypothetical protein [Acidobacteriota bacterium]
MRSLLSLFCYSLAASMMQAQLPMNLAPTRVVGHPSLRLVSTAPNLVEGRELYSPFGVAVDTSASPSAIYVADTGNNRVLGWRNAVGFNNGASADIVIGQRDFITTTSQGPGTPLSTGLSAPTAVAVDVEGNLYVADAGNNRILRYSRPFAQTDELKIPEMVIGQANYNARNPNPDGAPRANSLALNLGGDIFRTGLIFDANGNLWFSDAGNNRVLRYPADALRRRQNQPAADVVLGQFDFNTNNPNAQADRTNHFAMTAPSGLTFDNVGRLYVCDAHNRVLVYTNPASNRQAQRIMGVVIVPQGVTPPPDVNETTLGRLINNQAAPPESVFFASGTPYVVDTANHRILRFDPFESWPLESITFSPPARLVFGQTTQSDFTSSKPNRGLNEPSNLGFNTPVSAVAAGGDVYVVDTGNHRVLVMPLQDGLLRPATRLLGQAEFYQSAPNYVDGRELYLYNGFGLVGQGAVSDGAGIVVDSRSNPPRLYISDTYNHRVLGYKDARNVRPGDRADLVIGQRDLQRTMVNNPSGLTDQLTDAGLFLPAGLVVDAGGNLYVADAANGRVLRYQRPFEQQTTPLRPDLVLGQTSYFTKFTDATSRTMARPYGLAFTTEGHLLVSDASHNRILFFRKPAGGDFSSGQSAEKVFGQPDFLTIIGSNLPNRMISPHGIAVDSDDRLYVCDTGNNRLLIYDRVTLADTDPFPAFAIPGFSSPHGMFVSATTGEIWVTDTGRGRSLRFPRFDRLVFDVRFDYEIPSPGFPLAVTLDGFGNLLTAESVNRVSMYFPLMLPSNGGNQLSRFAPAVHATLKPVGDYSFGDATLSYEQTPDTPPMPTTLGDIQVVVNDVPAPIQSVSPGQINFLVPQGTPATGTAEVLAVRKSTGQILGTAAMQMSQYAPAFFTVNGEGSGQVLATNQDGTRNSIIERAGRSETLTLFGTGAGKVSGAPPDGAAAAEKTPIAGDLRLLMGTDFVPAENILYFGLAPGMVGVWQIDVKIPDRVPPDPQVPVVCVLNSIPCNQDGTGRRVPTFISVKP